MKNNDFDFIKSKFENAEQEAPSSLSAESIEAKIIASSEHKIIKFEKKRINFKPIISAAACFAIILGVLFAVNPDFTVRNKLTPFKDYDELNERVSTLEPVSPDSEMGCGNFDIVINNYEEGVEAPSIAKASNGHTYYAYYNHNDSHNRNKVYIFKAENENQKLVSIIDDFNLDDFEIKSLFAINNRLIVNFSASTATATKIYDITDSSAPRLIEEFKQSGEYEGSYITSNNLYVVTSYGVSEQSAENSLPHTERANSKTVISSKNIACFENAKSAQYAVISSTDIQTGAAFADLKAVLGNYAKAYCTKEYMYIIPNNNAEAIKLTLKSGKFSKPDEAELKNYSSSDIDNYKSDSFNGAVYPIENGFIGVIENMTEATEEIVLFDAGFNKIDSASIDDGHLYTSLASNKEKTAFAAPAYFADEARRYYGAVVFEIKDNKINITNKFINDDDNLMYQGECIFVGDYLYSIDINDFAPDSEKLTIYSYKY